jgi:hypothetical protein
MKNGTEMEKRMPEPDSEINAVRDAGLLTEHLTTEYLDKIILEQSDLLFRLTLLTLSCDPDNPMSWGYTPAQIVACTLDFIEVWKIAALKYAEMNQPELDADASWLPDNMREQKEREKQE